MRAVQLLIILTAALMLPTDKPAQKATSTVHCLYADIASDPGDTSIHEGACQQCGTDGQWFDVQGVHCPGCTDAKSAKQAHTKSQKPAAPAKGVAPEGQYCADSTGRAYSIGAIRHLSQCLRCDTHATFSPDNEENCKVCKH